MKDIFNSAYNMFNSFLEKKIDDYWNNFGYEVRRNQCMSLINSLNDRFNFETLRVLETGVSQSYRDSLWGLFLGFATGLTNGKMDAVDINELYAENSNKLFKGIIPNLDYQTHVQDSILFLENYQHQPNIVHLDSWDLDLKNPLPSALHGWKEFVAIKNKVPKGGIIIIDDNYIDKTWIEWNYPNGYSEKIVTQYPMTGKGSLIYHHVIEGKDDWELIGTHYNDHTNIKIIIQKI
jgi:hypothetical protein